MTAEQSPDDAFAIIEHGLDAENEYYGLEMTEEQLRRAAQIILAKEAPMTDVEHYQNSAWARSYREQKEKS